MEERVREIESLKERARESELEGGRHWERQGNSESKGNGEKRVTNNIC